MPDGTIIRSLNKLLKNNAGYDLKQLFIGSEGTLGVITRAVLRLQARADQRQHRVLRLPGFRRRAPGAAGGARARLGPALSSFEVMWPSFYDFMTGALPSLRRPFAEPHGMYLLIEASGFDAGRERDVLQDCLAGLLEQGAVTDAVVAASDRDARDLWAVRDSPSEYGKVLGPLTAFDVGLPASVTRRGGGPAAAGADPRPGRTSSPLFYGHIGDSNLHIVTNVPSASVQPSGPITDMVYDAIGRAGGTISAEHGIGLLKRPYLALSRSPEELALMRRLKSALDPDRTLNARKSPCILNAKRAWTQVTPNPTRLAQEGVCTFRPAPKQSGNAPEVFGAFCGPPTFHCKS